MEETWQSGGGGACEPSPGVNLKPVTLVFAQSIIEVLLAGLFGVSWLEPVPLLTMLSLHFHAHLFGLGLYTPFLLTY